MRLRNKKTGEIGELNYCGGFIQVIGIKSVTGDYTSLDELTDDWEDAPEEPKVGYIIDPMEEDCVSADLGYAETDIERAKELGIWLETKEEAEKAVEKLKAFKRLKDKGFRLNHWKEAQLRPNMSCVAITGNMKVDEEAKSDLDLLFGGEE